MKLAPWINLAKEVGKLCGTVTVAVPIAGAAMVGAVREAAALPQTSTENNNHGKSKGRHLQGA